MLLDQGVKEHDAFIFAKSREKGIGFAGPLGPVHDKDIGQRVMDRLGIGKDALSEFPLFQGRKFVEQGHDPGGRDKLDEQHVKGDRCPAKKPGTRACILEKGQNARQKGGAQYDCQDKPLAQVRHIGLEGGFVEPEAFLDHKGGIKGKGLRKNAVGQHQNTDIYQAGNHRSLPQGSGPGIQQGKSAAEPENEHDKGVDDGADPTEARVDLEIVLGFGIPPGIEDILKGLGHFIPEHLQVQGV